MIIGICGKAGSGKSTVASILAEVLPVDIVSLADPMKHAFLSMFRPLGVTDEMCFGPSSLRESLIPGMRKPITVRHALQTLGTEWGRVCLYPDVWLDLALARCADAERNGRIAVVPDVRYANEASAITRAGGVVWALSPRGPSDPLRDHHATEQGIDFASLGISPIFISNTGSLDDLRAMVRRQALKLTQPLQRV